MFELAISDHADIDVHTQSLCIILRFLSRKSVRFNSTDVALACLETAKHYTLRDFNKLILAYLEINLEKHNVFKVLDAIYPFSSNYKIENRLRSISEVMDDHWMERQNQRNIEQEMFDKAANNCLNLIDEHAEQLLVAEEFYLLHFSLVKLILSRDSLLVGDELSVIMIMDMWAKERCSMLGLAPSPELKQKVLGGPPIYLPLVRLLTLSRQDLQEAHFLTGLIPKHYMKPLLRVLSGGEKCSCPLPRGLQEYRDILVKPRTHYTGLLANTSSSAGEGKVWDCEAQEYKINEEDHHHQGSCEVDLLGNEDEILQEVKPGVYRWKKVKQEVRRRERKCNCVWVRTSRLYDGEKKGEFKKLQGVQRRGEVRNGRPRSNSWGCQHQREEYFNPIGNFLHCLTGLFD